MSFSFCLSEPLRVRAFVFDPFDDEDEVDVDPEENTVSESLNNLGGPVTFETDSFNHVKYMRQRLVLIKFPAPLHRFRDMFFDIFKSFRFHVVLSVPVYIVRVARVASRGRLIETTYSSPSPSKPRSKRYKIEHRRRSLENSARRENSEPSLTLNTSGVSNSLLRCVSRD